MGTHAKTIAAMLLLIACVAGCTRMTSGTVAQTTEPGPNGRSTFDPTGPPTSADALTITCKDYLALNRAAKSSVVDEIIKQGGAALDPSAADLSKELADAVCQFLPSSTVKEILVGGPVP